MDRLAWWGAGAAMLAGLAHAVSLRWTCDDAFISFRYARNLVRGNGLVFNVGEAVEGYTNFLWTLGVAVGMLLGVEPTTWTVVAGLASWLGVGGLLAWQARDAGRWPVGVWVWSRPRGRW